jgi:hypothetical protein
MVIRHAVADGIDLSDYRSGYRCVYIIVATAAGILSSRGHSDYHRYAGWCYGSQLLYTALYFFCLSADIAFILCIFIKNQQTYIQKQFGKNYCL